ncbi:hypothetical protein HDG37_005485 [Paraburkholderia sp. MM5384-R2]|nr:MULTISPECIES: hypothetical protein [Paraburkholderia]MBB5501256.1 hypothetical protein [Paraburkholderia sp. MM5384-R2]
MTHVRFPNDFRAFSMHKNQRKLPACMGQPPRHLEGQVLGLKADEGAFAADNQMAGCGVELTPERPTENACERRLAADYRPMRGATRSDALWRSPDLAASRGIGYSAHTRHPYRLRIGRVSVVRAGKRIAARVRRQREEAIAAV